MFMSQNVKSDASFTCSCSRSLVGESCFEVEFENDSNSDGYVGVTPSFPAKIIPVELDSVGGTLIAKGGAYFSHSGDVDIDVSCDCNVSDIFSLSFLFFFLIVVLSYND